MRRSALGAGARFASTVSIRGPTPSGPRRVEAALKRSAERLRRGRKLRRDGTHADSMSALETLRGELASLRQAGLPSWLESLSDPTPARYVAFPSGGATRDGDGDGDGDPTAGVVANPDQATGPWHVHAWLRGADGAGYHLSPTHFRLSFSAAYPREPPDVHVLSVCHHALLDDDKEVSALFYDDANLAPKDPETRPVEYDALGVLAACRKFLSQPLVLPGEEKKTRATEPGSICVWRGRTRRAPTRRETRRSSRSSAYPRETPRAPWTIGGSTKTGGRASFSRPSFSRRSTRSVSGREKHERRGRS